MRIEKIENDEELNKRFLYLKSEVEKYIDNYNSENYSKVIEQVCRSMNSKDYYWMKSILIASDEVKMSSDLINRNNLRDYNTLKKRLSRLNEIVFLNSSEKRLRKNETLKN